MNHLSVAGRNPKVLPMPATSPSLSRLVVAILAVLAAAGVASAEPSPYRTALRVNSIAQALGGVDLPPVRAVPPRGGAVSRLQALRTNPWPAADQWIRTATGDVVVRSTRGTILHAPDRTWYLEVRGDGSSFRYRGDVDGAARAACGDACAALATETVESLGRAFVANELAPFVSIPAGQDLVFLGTKRLVSASVDDDGGSYAASVLANVAVFGREIGGVFVAGPGSKVAVWFSAAGEPVAFDVDWPDYKAKPSWVGTGTLAINDVFLRLSAYANVPGDHLTSPDTMECGYVDQGVFGRKGSTLQAGCIATYVRSTPVPTPFPSRAATVEILPIGRSVFSDRNWKVTKYVGRNLAYEFCRADSRACRLPKLVQQPQTSPYVDNGDGTVTDIQTGLQWEKKSSDGGIHDPVHEYQWSTSGILPDGDAFTDFLATLNDGAGFAGFQDWRLPTIDELRTLLSGVCPGGADPCIDTAVFGPGPAGWCWTSEVLGTDPTTAAAVLFEDGHVADVPKSGTACVRAVRSTVATTTTVVSTTTTTAPPAKCWTDLGDGTVRDACTGLQWEKKTDDGGVHDKDDHYQWAGRCSLNTSRYCQPTPAAEALCEAQTPAAYWSTGCQQCAGGEGLARRRANEQLRRTRRLAAAVAGGVQHLLRGPGVCVRSRGAGVDPADAVPVRHGPVHRAGVRTHAGCGRALLVRLYERGGAVPGVGGLFPERRRGPGEQGQHAFRAGGAVEGDEVGWAASRRVTGRAWLECSIPPPPRRRGASTAVDGGRRTAESRHDRRAARAGAAATVIAPTSGMPRRRRPSRRR
jgi:hypothetical protein